MMERLHYIAKGKSESKQVGIVLLSIGLLFLIFIFVRAEAKSV